jgi:hypothetical protein
MKKAYQSTSVDLAGRPVSLRLSAAAAKALAQRTQPLYVQMELYFSCLLRFKLRFADQALDDHSVAVADKLHLSFRPIMTAQCGVDFEGDEPPVTDFPLHDGNAFMPRYVFVDYRHGRWCGEFGYAG